VDPGGFVVTCADDAGARRLASYARDRGIDVRTYGTSEDADLRLTGVTVSGTTSRYEPVLRGGACPPCPSRSRGGTSR
jgi:UDP-N-acetylmuramate--alanine ligase